MKGICIALVAILLLVAGMRILPTSRQGGEPEPPEKVEIPPLPESPESREATAERIRSRLVAAEWPMDAASAFVELNLDHCHWLQMVAADVLEQQLAALSALKPSISEAAFLTRHPEMTGMLLMVHDRQLLADAILRIDNEDDRNAIVGSFAKYTDAREASDWAKAIAKHGDCIAGILRVCPLWPVDAVFLYNDDPAMEGEYAIWLNEVFDRQSLPRDDEEIYSLMMFAINEGPNVRERMARDADFRAGFTSQIWPEFCEAMRQASEERETRVPWELISDCDPLWSMFLDPKGKHLFERAGQRAADLLYGNNGADPDLRKTVANLLLSGYDPEFVCDAFSADWKNDGTFVRLVLRRGLTDEQVLGCCQQLMHAKDPAHQLRQWNALSDAALVEDIGPPPAGLKTIIPGYAIYYAGKKLCQGRELDMGDALGLAGDVATLVTLGGSKAATEAAKKTATAALRQKFRAEAVKDIAKLTTKELAEEAAEKEVLAMAAHHGLRTLPKTMSEGFLKVSILDATPLVKRAFELHKRLGFGRESFRRITGLDARICMRKDAKVLISLPAAVAGRCPSAAFLNATALNGGADAVLAAEPVRTVVRTGLTCAKDNLTAWKQNLSCWWTTHATVGFNPGTIP